MDVSQLRCFLNRLLSENSTCIAKDTVETLLKIHRNIKFNLNDPKFRKIKLQNTAFKNKVWNLYPAQCFMLKSGWIVVGDEVQFHKDENLWCIIDILLEYRNVTPHNSEWQENTKIENLYTSKQKEEELRSKAALEREKKLAEYRKEKLYREQLAQNVKKQIADDRKNRRQYLNSPNNMPNGQPQPSYNLHHQEFSYHDFTGRQFHPSIQSNNRGSQQSCISAQPRSKQNQYNIIRRLDS